MRIDRSGALPDRCVICNAEAGGQRVAQKLYWSPLAWKMGAGMAPFVVLGVGISMQAWWMVAMFWPMVIVLVLINLFVRKSLRVEFGICARHRRIRTVLRALSIVCLVGVGGAVWHLRDAPAQAYVVLLASVAGIIGLALVQSFTGIQMLKLKELTPHHAWLARTGKPFRAALPELPGP